MGPAPPAAKAPGWQPRLMMGGGWPPKLLAVLRATPAGMAPTKLSTAVDEVDSGYCAKEPASPVTGFDGLWHSPCPPMAVTSSHGGGGGGG